LKSGWLVQLPSCLAVNVITV